MFSPARGRCTFLHRKCLPRSASCELSQVRRDSDSRPRPFSLRQGLASPHRHDLRDWHTANSLFEQDRLLTTPCTACIIDTTMHSEFLLLYQSLRISSTHHAMLTGDPAKAFLLTFSQLLDQACSSHAACSTWLGETARSCGLSPRTSISPPTHMSWPLSSSAHCTDAELVDRFVHATCLSAFTQHPTRHV